MNKFFSALILFLFLQCGAQSQSSFSRIKIDLSKTSIDQLNALGLETDHGSLIPGVHFVNEFSDREIKLIEDADIPFMTLIDDVQRHYHDHHDHDHATARSEEPCQESFEYDYMTPSNYTFGSMGGYHTLTEMYDVVDSMRTLFPHLITGRNAIGEIKTWNDNEIYWLRISNDPDADQEDKPEVLYTALHHAREPNGLSQMIFYMWYLLENYDTDPEVKYLVDNTEMYFIPCINPDGYQYNEETNPDGGGFWRKNRRPAAESDEVGVDLNRNYGYEWGIDDTGSSPNMISQTYRGPEAFSEPETQAIRSFSIDHEIEVVLNYHTFGNLLIHPWGYSDLPTEEDSTFKAMGNAMIAENGFVMGTGSETVGYIVNGDSDDYLYGEEGEKGKMYAFTPEVGSTFWPQSTQIDQLNKSCVVQNLATAHCVHNFYTATVTNEFSLLEQSDGKIIIDITKAGLDDGTAEVDVTSDNPFITFDFVETTVDLAVGSKTILEVPFTISEDAPLMMDVTYEVSIDNGSLVMADQYDFVYRLTTEQLLYSNAATDLSAWDAADGSWGLTEVDFISAPTALTDSPDGEYLPAQENIVVLRDEIDLTGYTDASLKFSAKWDIEANYDHCQIQASVDGQEWIPLCGNYTRAGIGSHGTDNPLYDGRSSDWVQESMSLTDFIDQTIMIRLVMTSDNFVQGDGFLIDDIEVVSLELGTTSTDEDLASMLAVYPSVTSGQLTISIPVSSGSVSGQLIDMSGNVVEDLGLLVGAQTYDLTEVANGLYIVTLQSDQGVVTRKITVQH